MESATRPGELQSRVCVQLVSRHLKDGQVSGHLHHARRALHAPAGLRDERSDAQPVLASGREEGAEAHVSRVPRGSRLVGKMQHGLHVKHVRPPVLVRDKAARGAAVVGPDFEEAPQSAAQRVSLGVDRVGDVRSEDEVERAGASARGRIVTKAPPPRRHLGTVREERPVAPRVRREERQKSGLAVGEDHLPCAERRSKYAHRTGPRAELEHSGAPHSTLVAPHPAAHCASGAPKPVPDVAVALQTSLLQVKHRAARKARQQRAGRRRAGRW
mmetsp:Transcript_10191/g.32267  ORF Transcript_10191/g.32267 Transcript_10191/m.32267 type:complete len:272 (-) Transcript_10191:182-997(-)